MATWTKSTETEQAGTERAPGQTVLFVDDEEAIRACMCAALTQAGYRVLQAGDGREAVRVLLSRHVDLLIADLIMPEQEGLETILYVRKHFPTLNVVAISGGDPSYLSVARKLGARAVLSKPFSADELIAAVDYTCPPGAEEDSAWQG
jgi:DNA-binding response OmpR family regulator